MPSEVHNRNTSAQMTQQAQLHCCCNVRSTHIELKLFLRCVLSWLWRYSGLIATPAPFLRPAPQHTLLHPHRTWFPVNFRQPNSTTFMHKHFGWSSSPLVVANRALSKHSTKGDIATQLYEESSQRPTYPLVHTYQSQCVTISNPDSVVPAR